MQPIRVMVIGAGSWRGAWFTSEFHQHPDFELAALVDIMPKVPAAVTKFLELGNIPIYSDAIEALDQVECDAVLIIVPDFLHKQYTLEALKRGKYVYIEKPMAINLPDCLEIVRADNAAGGKAMIGFNRRFVPSHRKLYQLVQQGLIGQPLTIQADEHYYNGRTYFRRWNRLRRMSGGLWVTKGCHDFDYQYWLTGSLPKSVSATASVDHYMPKPEASALCRDCKIEKDCPDSHLKFRGDGNYHDFPPLRRVIEEAREDSGAPADLCLYNAEKDTFDNGMALVTFENQVKASLTINVVAPFTDNRIRVTGTEGTLDASFNSPYVDYWKRHDGEDYDRAKQIPIIGDGVTSEGAHFGADGHLLDAFLGFIRGENPDAPRPAEACISIAIADAANRAGDEGRTIHLDEMEGWTELKSYL